MNKTIVSSVIKFERLHDIGNQEGQNSKVYLAQDLQLDAQLVVKEVPIVAGRVLDEYFEEARILYASSHPHIMELQYASQDTQNVYLTMPYLKNGSLNSLMEERYLTVKEIIKYGLDFLSGVHYIHTKGLIHFDIKPTNVLINDNNSAILTDFGLTKFTDASGIAEPDNMYIPHAPPEEAFRDKHTNHFDIYQCGLTLYRMCNGNEHFDEQLSSYMTRHDFEQAVQLGNFPNRKSYLPHIPLALRNIINKALSVDISDRYNTILDMMNDLSRIDKCLAWVYNRDKIAGTHVWTLPDEKGTHEIHLFEDTNKWVTVGKRVVTKEMRKKEWCQEFKKFPDAMKAVEQFIKKHK
ncbi:serine/threonine-protein kinase [Paenibacillus sp. BAC0078]